jgi:FtsK/SpoIIIE family
MSGLWFVPSLIFGVYQGLISGSWQMLLFSVSSLAVWPLNRIWRRHRDFALDGEVRVEAGRVYIGDHRLPRSELLWRGNWHSFIDLALQNRSAIQDSKRLIESVGLSARDIEAEATWLGVCQGKPLSYLAPRDGPHLVIIGATGTGKSELLRLATKGWLSQSKDLELVLIDCKGGAALAPFASSDRVKSLATDMNPQAIQSVSEVILAQLQSRQHLFAAAEASNIEDFVAKGFNLARLIIVIDELGELIRSQPKLLGVLEQVAARGRSLGLHLVLTNQSLSGVPRALLVNLRARIAIGEMDPIDLNQLGFKNRASQTVLDEGWRWARFKSATGFEADFCFPVGF